MSSPTPIPDPRQFPLPVIIQQQMMHSGPLPAPAQLGEYEAVYPGSAKWIFDQAEKNAEHVRTMERRGWNCKGAIRFCTGSCHSEECSPFS
jgi:uncharacterized membrane protein